MSRDNFICPSCRAEVPAQAKACPECGSDEKTGWSEDAIYDGTDIEDPDEFDYEDWRRRESLRRTLRKRPDLLGKAALSEEDRKIVEALKKEE